MSVTLPGPTLGVVGGGQLGRMLAEAAAPLGVDVVVLDPTPDCPAARVADQIEGDFDDEDAVFDLADRVDVLTYEIELADPDLLDRVAAETDTPVHPDPETLRTTGDKLREKEALAEADIPVPEFVRVDSAADLADAVEAFGGVMAKARRGGYDGRGNAPVESPDDAEAVFDDLGPDALAEELVDFERELAVIGVRGPDAKHVFPVTETIHEDEILRATTSPPRVDDESVLPRANEVAMDVLDELDGRGVFGIELFETSDGEILVNEIAPRPHNSGHWTIEGCRTSQFEQHLRAVLGWPPGSTERLAPTASVNLLPTGTENRPAELQGVETVLAYPRASLHWYGKAQARPLRKMGHVTVVAETGPSELTPSPLSEARDLADGLRFD